MGGLQRFLVCSFGRKVVPHTPVCRCLHQRSPSQVPHMCQPANMIVTNTPPLVCGLCGVAQPLWQPTTGQCACTCRRRRQ